MNVLRWAIPVTPGAEPIMRHKWCLVSRNSFWSVWKESACEASRASRAGRWGGTNRAPPATRSTPALGSTPARPRTRKSPAPSSAAGLKSSGASATVKLWLARCLHSPPHRVLTADRPRKARDQRPGGGLACIAWSLRKLEVSHSTATAVRLALPAQYQHMHKHACRAHDEVTDTICIQ